MKFILVYVKHKLAGRIQPRGLIANFFKKELSTQMDRKNTPLNRIDRAILDSYISLMDGLSEYLGDGYELVLHSLEDLDHSVIKILNGFHTGRREGSPITDLALTMLSRIQEQNNGTSSIAYFSKNKSGEPLKCSTICIRGDKGKIIGLLCINLYLNTSLADIVRHLVPADGGIEHPHRAENFVNSADDLFRQIVTEVRNEIFNDTAIPASARHKEIIRKLYDRGIFRLKDGVGRTAGMLNISKNTVYLHLRPLNKN